MIWNFMPGLYRTMCTISNTMRNILTNWNLCIVLCHSPVSCTVFFSVQIENKFWQEICCNHSRLLSRSLWLCISMNLVFLCLCLSFNIALDDFILFVRFSFAFLPFQTSSFHAMIFCKFIVLKRLTLFCALSFRRCEFFFVSNFFFN